MIYNFILIIYMDNTQFNLNNIILDDQDKKCSPTSIFEFGSCLTIEALIEMIKAYNKEHSNDTIQEHSNLNTLNPSKYKIYLLEELSKKTKNECTNQKCWTTQSFMKHLNNIMREQIIKFTWRTDGPQGRFDWLSTYNVNGVMEQTEKKYTEFKFLGAVPMDFDNLPETNIPNLNIDKYIKNNKNKFGIIFNLDESWKSGSHWVSFFSDINNGSIYYFDSYGIRPEPRVRKLMRKFYNYCTEHNINAVSDYNKIRHQYGGSECGVYSINFIKRLLKGHTFQDICQSKVKDIKINKCRKVYFGNTDF